MHGQRRRLGEVTMAKRKFPRTHTFKLKVAFNKGCRRALALHEVRAHIGGKFHCTSIIDSTVVNFRISSISSTSTRRR